MDGHAAGRGVLRCSRELEEVAARIGPRFGRPELRAHAPAYLRGLVAGVERKNGWQLAEFLGDPSPANLRHFTPRVRWAAGAVRDGSVRYVVWELCDDEVRGRAGWHRHVTLSTFAHAMPAVIRARPRRGRQTRPAKKGAIG